jgi:ThiF family/Prokaryotic E2 family B
MPPWWEREPGRLEYEVRALEAAGIPYERDEVAFAAGVARLRVHPQIEGASVELVVTFPDLYPYFRFSIQAPITLGLAHHQAPLGSGALCILGRSTEEWRTSDTVAGLLQTQLPKLVAAGRSEDRNLVAGIEAHQAEPFSEWYSYAPAMLQIDGAWRIPDDAKEGQFTASVWRIVTIADGVPLVSGAVVDVRDQLNRVVARIDERRAPAPGSESWTGRWIRVAEPMLTSEPAALFRAIGAQESRPIEPPWNKVNNDAEELQVQLRAVVFPEEHAWRDSSGQGWLFVLHGRTRRIAAVPNSPSKYFKPRRPAGAQPKWRERFSVARAGRSGPEDLGRRVPELLSVRTSKVALVGLGCLGAPSALEFARAQVSELRIMDGDFVDPGTVVRWPFGLSVAGLPKALVIGDTVTRDYPYTRVVPELRQLGAVRDAPQASGHGGSRAAPRSKEPDATDPLVESDYVVLERFTKGVSLLYDASAEFGVQYFLSEFARARKLPYLSVAGTPGGWGGRIVRIRPGATKGCWACMQASRLDESLPDPPADPRGLFQAEGCADVTFTAAGYDMVTIAMQGVRMAMSMLCEGVQAHPSTDADVAIISLRDESGRMINPVVKTYALPRHPSCPVCAKRL